MSLFESASLVVTPNGINESKLYAIKPTDGSGDLSVVRATTATRVNSAGLIESVSANVPRLDYTNGSCPSILVEPQRTNLLTYSEQFDNAAWSKTRATITANATTSPDGNNTADLVSDTTFTNNINYTENFLSVGSNEITISVFVKKGTAPYVSFGFYDNDFHGFVVDTTTWASSYTFGSATNFIATNYGNGWYRLSMTKQSATNFIYPSLAVQQNSNGSNYNGTGVLNAYFWGFQIEIGSYATSYIPTTSASVTRNADVISKTGISDLIGQTEGTIFLDVKAQLNTADEQDFTISDGTTNNRVLIRITSTGVIRAIGLFGGDVEFNIGGTFYTTGSRYKIALGYKNNDVVLYINGTSVEATNTTTISGTLSRLGFDVFTNGAQIIVSPINSSALWKTRLTNDELATLTTI